MTPGRLASVRLPVHNQGGEGGFITVKSLNVSTHPTPTKLVSETGLLACRVFPSRLPERAGSHCLLYSCHLPRHLERAQLCFAGVQEGKTFFVLF